MVFLDQKFAILGPFKMAKKDRNNGKSLRMPSGSGTHIWWLGDPKMVISSQNLPFSGRPKWPKMHKIVENPEGSP